LERLKQAKYNKPHWLRYIRGHEPPGPIEEEEEDEEKKNDTNKLTNCHKFVQFPLRWNNAKLHLYTDLERSKCNLLWAGIALSV
jgi:hypothetical protein